MSDAVHTYMICPDCGEGVRASRHSSDDCATIQRLKRPTQDGEERLRALDDDAAAEWFADAAAPGGLEPENLVPFKWAMAAWKECRSRAALEAPSVVRKDENSI
jgi:hypothetical protein